MPKVLCFAIPGLSCWFWSNDHEPPHFHAKRAGQWEIRVKFTMAEDRIFEMVWGDMPRGKLFRRLRDAVCEHRDELLAEWEANRTE